MSSHNQNQINRLNKEIADLRKSDAQEARKEADLLTKANRAADAAANTRIASTLKSKLKEVERANASLASVQKKRGDIAGKIAAKTKSLNDYQNKQARDDEKARKKAAEEQKKLMREREAHERRITAEIRSRAASSAQAVYNLPVDAHDFFISHASEDKDGFVRQLAETLREKGANVWYDEFTLKVGDSLRRNIDRGLAASKFGVVILSEHFFRKEWPNRELDGLFALEEGGQTRILPIWHKVSKDEVAEYSPTLVDKVALNTAIHSVEKIAEELMSFLD